jgi:hypothetical protein
MEEQEWYGMGTNVFCLAGLSTGARKRDVKDQLGIHVSIQDIMAWIIIAFVMNTINYRLVACFNSLYFLLSMSYLFLHR